jgi:hypothetical protein
MGCTCNAIVRLVGIIALAMIVIQASFGMGCWYHKLIATEGEAVLIGSEGEELQTISIVDQPKKKKKKEEAFVASVTCVS